jgi:hypothetical protein
MRAGGAYIEVDCNKRSIINFDANFFNWGYEKIILTVFADDAGEKFHKWFAADGSAEVKPCTISRDTHV